MRIAILGLGRMGTPMARNLIEAGNQVVLYNRTRAKALELAATGARAAHTVADAAGEAQIALTMVTDDTAEEALTLGPGGLLKSLPSGAVHLCMSSIGVDTSRRLAAAHEAAGQGYVAAPVLGRPGAATLRHLWILASGPDLQVNRCLPILETLGRGVTRVGARPELAHSLKLAADALTVAMVEALSEVLAFGEKAGTPPAEYLRILNLGLFNSPLLDSFGGFIVRRDHQPTHQTLDLAATGMERLVQAAGDLKVAMPMAGPLLQLLQSAQAKGLGDRDITALSLAGRMEAGHGAPVAPDRPGPEAKDKPGPETLANAEGPSYTVRCAEGTLRVDLWQTTHFELSDGVVWAWVAGQRHPTFWRNLDEVELPSGEVGFVRIQRRILLNPHAVKDLTPRFGGGARVVLTFGPDLTASREAVPRLKHLLGL